MFCELNDNNALTKPQKEIMSEFYSMPPARVILNKSRRNTLWNKTKTKSSDIEFDLIENICPALAHQIRRSYESENNIQSAVFSECVYAQTIANMFNLNTFVNCYSNPTFIPESIKNLLYTHRLFPRYAYSSENKDRMLIQAGGCNGIDSALVSVSNLVIYTIEFKEPGAKTSEHDLPKYNENGIMQITELWKNNNSQFLKMLSEKPELNFFEHMGHNINDFSNESVMFAVSNNYTNQMLDVICTEDKNGYLVMMPANQVHLWAKIEGEIRPSGRNNYPVWTPDALMKFILDKGAVINENLATIPKNQLIARKARGSGKISGYKINPLFFVYKHDYCDNNDTITFELGKVRQLNPTISAKVFFKTLQYSQVKSYYGV